MPLRSAWVWYHLNFEDCALSLTAGQPSTQWHLHANPFLFNRCYSSVRYCLHQQILNYNASTWHLLKKPKSTKPLHSVWEGQLRLEGHWAHCQLHLCWVLPANFFPGIKKSVLLYVWIFHIVSLEILMLIVHGFCHPGPKILIFLHLPFLPQFKFYGLVSWGSIIGATTIMKFRSKMSARYFVGMHFTFL